MRPSLVLSEAGAGLRRERTMTIAALLTAAIALTLLGGALMARAGAASLRRQVVNGDDVSVYLHPPCRSASSSPLCSTAAGQAAIARTLREVRGVHSVVFVSQPQAQQLFAQFVGGADVVIRRPDLPPYFAVQLDRDGSTSAVRVALTGRVGVASIGGTSPANGAVVSFFNQLTLLASIAALFFVLLAGVLIYITMGVAAFSKRDETAVMQLIGASDMHIRLPFILRGAIIGAISSMFALTMLLVARWFVATRTSARALVPLGQWSTFWHAAPLVLVIGIALAVSSSWLTLRRYLTH